MGGLILTARKNRLVPSALCDSRALAPNKVVSPEGVSGERGGDSQRPTSCQLLSLSLSLSFFLSFIPLHPLLHCPDLPFLTALLLAAVGAAVACVAGATQRTFFPVASPGAGLSSR